MIFWTCNFLQVLISELHWGRGEVVVLVSKSNLIHRLIWLRFLAVFFSLTRKLLRWYFKLPVSHDRFPSNHFNSLFTDYPVIRQVNNEERIKSLFWWGLNSYFVYAGRIRPFFCPRTCVKFLYDLDVNKNKNNIYLTIVNWKTMEASYLMVTVWTRSSIYESFRYNHKCLESCLYPFLSCVSLRFLDVTVHIQNKLV
jgi:hypothetical protein